MKAIALLVLALPFAAPAQDAKPNFSGTWELQVAQSDFGPLPGPESLTNVVDHREPKVKITSTAKTAEGDRVTELLYTTDGEECSNQIRGSTAKSRTRWVERELVTEMQLELQGAKLQLKDRWSLSEDGQTWTIHRSFTSAEMGEAAQKLILTRK
jgi:hypothetical protein